MPRNYKELPRNREILQIPKVEHHQQKGDDRLINGPCGAKHPGTMTELTFTLYRNRSQRGFGMRPSSYFEHFWVVGEKM